MPNTLENQNLRVAFSEQGALTELLDKRSGWSIHRRPELALSFIAYLPIPNRRNNQIHGLKQTAPQIDATETAITFTWQTLTSEHGGKHPITLQLTAELCDGELSCQIDIDNQSDACLETIAWPCIGDLNKPDKTERMETATFCNHTLFRNEIFPKFVNHKGGYGVDFPTQMMWGWSSPFQLIESDEHGLYVGHHDFPMSKLLTYIHQLKPGWEYADSIFNGTVPTSDEISGQPVHIEFLPTHYPFLNPGKSITLAPVVLAPYTGTWHNGADHYKQWRNTWYTAPEKPEWAKHPHSWQQIHINSPEDELRCRYEDLVQYGHDAKKHGVKAIQLTGWTKNGQDMSNPSHDVDGRLGTTEDLKNAIADIHALGVKVILFNKYTWADRGTDRFKNDLHRLATKDPSGNAHFHAGYQYQTPTQLADINTRRFSPMCPLAQEWRDIAVEEFTKSIDLGAAGILYDECFHHGIMSSDNMYCFDASHGHESPEYIYAGDRLLEEAFKNTAAERNPEFLFSGEVVPERSFLTYHLSYFRHSGLNSEPVGRYVDNDLCLMMAISGHRDYNNVNFALMHRYILSHEPRLFKGKLDEYPVTITYAKAMDEFRTRYRQWLWDGEYHHTLGASVTCDGKRHPHFSRYTDADGNHGVVICNFDNKQEHIYQLNVPGVTAWAQVSPGAPDPVNADHDRITIPPHSAVFLIQTS